MRSFHHYAISGLEAAFNYPAIRELVSDRRDEIAHALTHGDVALLVTVPRFLRHDYVAALDDIVPAPVQPVPADLAVARSLIPAG